MQETTETSISQLDQLFGTTVTEVEVSNNTYQVEDKETYLERTLGFLIIGGIGIISNLFAMFVLGSSARLYA